MCFRVEEIEKSGLTSKVCDNFGAGAVSKIKSLLCRPKVNKIEMMTRMTLQELIGHK